MLTDPVAGDSGQAGMWEGCSSQWSAWYCLQVPCLSTGVDLGSPSWRGALVPESQGATQRLAGLAVDSPEMSVHPREQVGLCFFLVYVLPKRAPGGTLDCTICLGAPHMEIHLSLTVLVIAA